MSDLLKFPNILWEFAAFAFFLMSMVTTLTGGSTQMSHEFLVIALLCDIKYDMGEIKEKAEKAQATPPAPPPNT